MIDLTQIHAQYPPKPSPSVSLMTDGAEIFPYLWRYFLSHQHIRDWLMRAPPFTSASMAPAQIAQGSAFCCNFSVPQLWSDMAPSFDLGEMFVPDHPYSHFMCGSMVAATSFHKHLVCALGPAASRTPASIQAYSTKSRRIVVDMGSSRSINIIEFSWMSDGALMVIVKVLVPPDPKRPFDAAGCTGAFAVFTDVSPAGPLPVAPRSLVSFLEAPRCPSCIQTGSLGCYCQTRPALPAPAEQNTAVVERSSAVWPPRLQNDVVGSCADTYDNVRHRLKLIDHMSHVKVTAHLVTTRQINDEFGRPTTSYRLGPSRFVVKAVVFRPANNFETDTLRQAADKLRLLRSGALRLAGAFVGNTQSSQTTFFPNDVRQFSIMDVNEGAVDGVSRNTSLGGSEGTEGSLPSDERGHTSGDTTSPLSIIPSLLPGGLVGPAPSLLPPSLVISTSQQGSTTDHDVSDIISAPLVSSNARLACPKCDKTFSQQGSLNRHLKNIHDQRKIPCDYCHMTFGQMFDLKRHQRRKHADKQATTIRRDRIETRMFRIPVGRVAD